MRKPSSSSINPHEVYARYEPPFSTLPKELTKVLVKHKIGRNGWPVAIALCIKVYKDGTFGLASSEWIQELTGLTSSQVARGMKELRDAEIICPIVHRTKSGAGSFDRSCYGHVARYQFTKQVWEAIQKECL